MPFPRFELEEAIEEALAKKSNINGGSYHDGKEIFLKCCTKVRIEFHAIHDPVVESVAVDYSITCAGKK